MTHNGEVVMDHDAIARAIAELAGSIAATVPRAEDLGLVGIHTGGVPLARRLASQLSSSHGLKVPVGSVDIAFYRDDAATALPDPKIGPSDVPFDPSGRDVVLADDVLQTGRTVRAALDCLLDFGRPRRVWLAVLCDRGGHELPIAADFVGQALDAPRGSRVEVDLTGPRDLAVLVRPPTT